MFFSIRKPGSVSPVRDLCYKSEFVSAWELTLSPVDQCRQTWTREWALRGPPFTLPLSTASKRLCLEMQPLLSQLYIIRLRFCLQHSSQFFLVNNQLDAQFFFLIYLFQFSTCFEHPCAHHQENQLY